MLSIHGYRSNAAQQEKLSGFSALADSDGFIVLYPDGLDDKWRFAGRTDADVKFLLAAIEAVAAKAPVDRNRIYSTGISNGAQMSWRLACDVPDVFAAFGFVSGAYLDVCNPPPRRPLIIFHGTADKLLAYDGKGPFMGVRDFAIRWASGSGCNPAKAARDRLSKGRRHRRTLPLPDRPRSRSLYAPGQRPFLARLQDARAHNQQGRRCDRGDVGVLQGALEAIAAGVRQSVSQAMLRRELSLLPYEVGERAG